MKPQQSFSSRLLIGFVAAAIGALVLSFYLMSRDDYGADRYGPSSLSTSAIGYAGIADLLKRLGVPVVISRSNSVKKADNGVLIIAEPGFSNQAEKAMPALLRARKVLFILPKWEGIRGEAQRGWIERVRPRWPFDIKRALTLVLPESEVEKASSTGSWTVNRIGVAPPLKGEVQVIKSGALTPLVAAGEQILLGEIRKNGRQIWILSDPDLIANHGFGADGKGAVFAVKMIEALRGGSGPVVFDEAIHHAAGAPGASAARLLFTFPYSIIALQVALGVGLLLWATMGRFGPPEAAPDTLAAGKAGLVDNVARLMEFAGHEKLMVRRYVEAMMGDAARQLHAPKGLHQDEVIKWLQRVGEARNVSLDGEAIAARADDLIGARGVGDMGPYVSVARDIYRWKQEILDGPSRHPRHNRGRSR
jgi:hypothetical protein